jgi:hypothetical protein
MSDPVKTGIPMSIPIWAVFHSKIRLSTRKVTSTPFNIHAAKQMVNAMVLRAKTL